MNLTMELIIMIGNSLVGIIGGIIGGIFIFVQIKRVRVRTRAKYISDLVRDFRAHLDVYKMLCPGGKYHEDLDNELLLEDIPLICEYLGFFEKIYFLSKREVIELDAVAELFTYRLTVATNNQKIQSKILCNENLGEALCKVVNLHNEISEYWKNKVKSPNVPRLDCWHPGCTPKISKLTMAK